MFFPFCLRFLLFLATSVASVRALKPGHMTAARYKPAQFSSPSPNVVSQHTLSLKRKTGVRSLSSSYLRAYRAQFGEQPITSVEIGEVFLTEIEFGTESFEVVIDTGSSDTWLVEIDFTCVDPATSETRTEEECDFGGTYTRSATFEQIPDENFDISYADGEMLVGVVGYESVTLAGIEVPHQEVGVVDLAGWFGDGRSGHCQNWLRLANQ